MGDNIYGDVRRPFKLFGKERTIGPWKNVPRFYPSSEQEMKSRYEQAKTIPGYSSLRRKTKVLFYSLVYLYIYLSMYVTFLILINYLDFLSGYWHVG